MSLATTFGLTMAVAIIMVVPLYADAVSFRVLEDRLSTQNNGSRPPFAYMFSYIGAWRGALQWEEITEADEYMQNQAGNVIPLEQLSLERHFETAIYQMFPEDTAIYDGGEEPLTLIKFAATTRIEENITLLEGSWPAAAPTSGSIPVAITEQMANDTGWQIGETYIAFNNRLEGQQQTFPIVISGIWQPINGNDNYWVYEPPVYEDLLLVPESTFVNRISPEISDEVNLATWYFVFDGSRVGTDDVDPLIGSASIVERQLQTILPNISTFISPADALFAYRREVSQLSTLLFAFNVPTIGLVLAFIGLVGGLAVNQRRNEFAVVRSRGGTAVQVISVALLEIILIGAVAFVLGSFLSLYLTQWVGRTRSFLDFTSETPVRVALTADGIRLGLITIGIAIMAQLIPTIANARHTIVSYKNLQARSLIQPWWQRAYIDLILLGITIYGFYTLRGQGALIISSTDGDFQNPLLFGLPAFTIFSVALLFLRLLPLAMRGVSWLLRQTDSITLLQAARYLARTPQHYNTPLILLILTVSFAVFTASLARTLDFYLYDAFYYATGSDLNMVTSIAGPFAFGNVQNEDEAEEEEALSFLPVSDYETIPGVSAATRVGEYRATANIGTTNLSARFMGVDRLDFPEVAYWRWDFSEYRLGSLMNGLGNAPEGILVPESFLRGRQLRAGDSVRITVRIEEIEVEYNAKIVGTFEYFPTWYPQSEELLFVGNLDYIFEQAGGEFPYRVWASTNGQQLNEGLLRSQLNQLSLFGTIWDEPHTNIQQTLVEPVRQGLFGLLSVGFIAASVLTVLGLLLYTVFSYRRRLVELGVLRAVGLPANKMTRLVGWELALLILSGIFLGTSLGVGVSALFIPFLQIGERAEELVPPFVIEVAWDAVSQVYILFGLLFIIGLIALVLLATRMKIFMAIKLGETV
ncbi:MAG: ABC transporter permease [Chloroflexota bacterium]